MQSRLKQKVYIVDVTFIYRYNISSKRLQPKPFRLTYESVVSHYLWIGYFPVWDTKTMDVEVQEKARKNLRAFLRSLESDDWHVLVKFDSPAKKTLKNYMCARYRLILPEATAIGIRLSHASREGSALGWRLSNTWIICPKVEDNLGKLRIILHRSERLECT